jgi:hypothetical protein
MHKGTNALPLRLSRQASRSGIGHVSAAAQMVETRNPECRCLKAASVFPSPKLHQHEHAAVIHSTWLLSTTAVVAKCPPQILFLLEYVNMVIVDPKIVARTERLLIRPLVMQDAEDVVLMRSHAEVMKHT